MSVGNIAQQKSFEFALEVIHVYRKLKVKGEYEIGRQLLKAGTSIGANIEEAIGSFSRKDFLYKITTAYKEARETHYWLKLILCSGILKSVEIGSLLSKSEELIKITGSIQKTTRENMSRNNP